MKKLLFLPILALGITYPDFSLCYKRYKKYTIIPISKYYSVTAQKPTKYVKYDEDLGLYLIKTYNKKYIHFTKSHMGVWLASITKDTVYSGNYASYQHDVYKPAKFSTKTSAGSIMTDIFCNPVGIGVKGGFLTKRYIYKFITSKPPRKDFLKWMGIIFNRQLIITKILPDSQAAKRYLSTGGRIVRINNHPVYTIWDIKKYLHPKKNYITILQDGFAFTIEGYK
ncbi:MAG: hypothetical protein GXO40_02345 [Epsilonproteobacteria bacterium]|nr:hypothetical protein [Campylobacterota bacterium]